MKAYHLTFAAAAGLLLAVSAPASATPLASASPSALGVDRFDGEIETVHYRRRAARHYYRSGPVFSFGLSPYSYVSPYYARPYAYPYGYRYSAYPYHYGYGAYPYSYGYAPTFSFGFRLR